MLIFQWDMIGERVVSRSKGMYEQAPISCNSKYLDAHRIAVSN